MRVRATGRVRLLRRILRHLCAAFCAAPGGLRKIGIGHLQIVPQGDPGGVAQPVGHHVQRIIVRWDCKMAADCTPICATLFRKGRFSRLFFASFESYRGSSPTLRGAARSCICLHSRLCCF